jgi:hypothetical protein
MIVVVTADIVDLAVRAGTMATNEDSEEDDEILFPSRSSPQFASRTSPSMAGRLLAGERERSSPGQTASDLLLQVLNGPNQAAQTSLSRRSSQASPEPFTSNVISGSIWAPNAAELPPPSSFTNAAWSHPFGAAPLSRDRTQQPTPQQHFQYG